MIDEAHLLGHEQLESIRMLTIYEMDSSTLFAIILIGQPTGGTTSSSASSRRPTSGGPSDPR